MTDTLKRLAGPTQPAQTDAGTLLYTAGGSTVTAVKSALITNTDPVFGAYLSMAIGSDLSVATGLDNRIVSQFYIAPGDTVLLPLDVILGNNETIYARQSCLVDPSQIVLAAATPAVSAASATTIASGSWTEAANDLFLMTVAWRSGTITISSFTDTHSGVTWTLLQGPVVNLAATATVAQYIAKSSGTTSTTTTVTFSNAVTSSLAIDKITALTSAMADTSGANGLTGFRPLGTYEAAASATPLIAAKEVGASVLYGIHHPTVTEAHTPMTGWTEIDDIATNAGSLATAYLQAPASWARPAIATGTTGPQGFFTEVLNSKRSLTVSLNGVEVT